MTESLALYLHFFASPLKSMERVKGIEPSYVMKWNGSGWSALEPEIGWAWDPYDEPHVKSLAVSGTNVYAGGEFQRAGGVAAHCITRWNGNNWSQVSSATAAVTALAGSGNEVYAAGRLNRPPGSAQGTEIVLVPSVGHSTRSYSEWSWPQAGHLAFSTGLQINSISTAWPPIPVSRF